MTEEKLREALNEALAKQQIGLFIWSNWSTWNDIAFALKPGDKDYDFALSQITRGKEAIISVIFAGFNVPSMLAIPVKELSSSEKYFKHVLTACEKGHFEGPITLIPKNEVSEAF